MSKFLKAEKVCWSTVSSLFNDKAKLDRNVIRLPIGIDLNDDPYGIYLNLEDSCDVSIVGLDYRKSSKYITKMAEIVKDTTNAADVILMGSKEPSEFLNLLQAVATEVKERKAFLMGADAKNIAAFNKMVKDKSLRMNRELIFIYGFENAYANSNYDDRKQLEYFITDILRYGRITGIHIIAYLGVSNTPFGRTVATSTAHRINVLGSGDLVETSVAFGSVHKVLRIPTED